MVTKLNRPVTRETTFRYQGRAIIVRLEEGGKVIRVKSKGRRQWYTATVEQLFWIACRNFAAEIKAAKKKAREERRKERMGA